MGNGLALIAFVAGSLVLAAISWRSLLHRRRHGFTRWLAWEGILALILLNSGVWFTGQYTAEQLFSQLLLMLSLLVVLLGVVQLKRHGRAGADSRNDPALFAFERTAVLVNTGIYAWIRHPMYLSLMLLGWGAAVKRLDWLTLGLALFVSGCLYVTARRDERECLEFFGDAYARYMQGTRRFIPFVW